MSAKLFAAACAAIAASAITASSLIAAPRRIEPPVKIDTASVAKDNNAFALELFQELSAKEKGNLFFSPYSISSALGMTYAGAKDKTASGMEKALHLSLSGNSFHSSLAALSKQLEKDATDNKYQLSIANQLWGDQFFKKFFFQSFLDLNKKIYGATLETLDFTASTAAAATINKWVSKKTNEKIKDLVTPGMFEGEDPVALVLTNAVYFKGDWASKFEKSATQSDSFLLGAKESIKADLMFQQGDFLYKEDSEAQILALPYQGGSLHMVVILPTKKDGLPALEKSLSLAKLDGWVSSMFTEDVKVKLPKFKTESSFGLNKPLQKMGMQDAFDAKAANFSGIIDLQKLSEAMGDVSNLYISDVVHKSFVEVNEAGSEAAAATAVIMAVATDTAEPQQITKEFTANHPFLYLIRDVKTGAILFMGRMQNPKA
jgi:serine protease inhibitor